jgi:hypothetical protein
MIKKIASREALEFGFNAFKENWIFFLVFMILQFAAFFGFSSLQNALKDAGVISFIVGIISYVISVGIGMMGMSATLKLTRQNEVDYSDLFTYFPLFFNYLIGAVLVSLICLAGFILLIVPGFIWCLQFSQATYLILDQGLDPIAALKKSSAITKGAKRSLAVFYFLLMLANMAGLLCLGIGLFVAMPVTMVASAYVYRKLMEEASVTGV